MDPLRLRLEVTERDAPLIQASQLVRARVEGIDREHVGRITRISPAIDFQRRMLVVEADIANDGSLHPGMFARAAIVVNPAERAVTVPAAALVTFAGIEKVFTVEAGVARERVITTGRRGADWIEVVQPLTAGVEVILNPGSLQNGQPVSASGISPESAPATTTASPPDTTSAARPAVPSS
jgi:RND family efflux transporter MFP subunit